MGDRADAPAGITGSGAAIEAKGLYHIYRESEVETVALRGADLALARGAWTSLMGPSGSGKSTLMQVMAGLLEPSGGAVMVDGRAPGEISRRVDELLAQLGLAARRRHTAGALSGGEAQRAAIAVALAPRPEVLMADEPTGELDEATAADVLDLLELTREREGTTVLTVTHNSQVAARAGRRVIMRDGLVLDDE